MKSPGTKGLSSKMETDAKTSPRMFWVASATATPPTPSPVTRAVMLIPRLSSATSTRIAHSTSLIPSVSRRTTAWCARQPPGFAADSMRRSTSSRMMRELHRPTLGEADERGEAAPDPFDARRELDPGDGREDREGHQEQMGRATGELGQQVVDLAGGARRSLRQPAVEEGAQRREGHGPADDDRRGDEPRKPRLGGDRGRGGAQPVLE